MVATEAGPLVAMGAATTNIRSRESRSLYTATAHLYEQGYHPRNTNLCSRSHIIDFAIFLHRDMKSLPLKDGRTFFAEGDGGLMRISRTKTAHDGLNLVLEGTFQLGL